jgi:2'-phosphotransferase
MTREVQVSKKISWLLRHGAEKEGLKLGPGGYINVQDVVGALLIVDRS